MKNLWTALKKFFSPSMSKAERYLNESVDIYELEFRQRQLDRGVNKSNW